MTYSRRKILQVAAGTPALTLPWLSGSASAQADYPNKQITAVCMFPAGTGADVFVRFYGNLLTKKTGQPVIVENKVGAFGSIATEAVARSKPDGYTIYIAPGSSVLATSPHIFNKLNYDPINDFEHVATFAKLSFIFVVAPNSPFKSMADLTAYLKQQGDKASYGSVANTGLVTSELYKAQFGLQTVEVKYRQVQDALNDLLGGQIAFISVDPVFVVEQEKAGRIRTLAVTSAERMKALPHIPGARESGLTQDVIAWWSVHVPAKTPRPIVEKLEKWFIEIAKSKEAVDFLTAQGSDPFPGDSKFTKELLLRDTKRWGEYVALAKIPKL